MIGPHRRTRRARFVATTLATAFAAWTCGETTAPPEPVPEFEAAWAAVDSVYPYLEYKSIDWDNIGALYRSRAERADAGDVDVLVLEMLGELRDGHVFLRPANGRAVPMQRNWVSGSRGEVWPYFSERQQRALRVWTPALLPAYFGPGEIQVTPDSLVGYGILGGDVGYIYASQFYPTQIVAHLDAALEFVQGTRALIVDIRNNNGGSGQITREFVGRFLTEAIPGLSYYKREVLHQGTPVAVRGPFQYTNPVVLLVNGRCFSAPEGFAEMMKQIPHVTLLGDTTAGGSGGVDNDTPGFFRLPGGAELQVPTLDVRRYDGLPWEGLGIAPDVYVDQTEADRATGIDRQLEAALARLR